MTIAEITAKIIAESNGNIHDIEHFLKVYAYARTLGELEALDAHTQFVLEAAALLHDIACPLCREKYGSCPGNLQEAESKPLVEAFLKDSGMPQDDIDRIAWIVSHHHTYGLDNGADYQLLLQADYFVNAADTAPEKAVREKFILSASGRSMAGLLWGNA